MLLALSRRALSNLKFGPRPRRVYYLSTVPEYKDEDDEVIVTKTLPSTSNTKRRNRLHALRKQLDADKNKPLNLAKVSSSCSTDARKNTNNEEDAMNLLSEIRRKKQIQTHSPEPQTILTDSHNRMHNYLRISLSEKCNLRCLYCMPPEGVPLQPDKELLSLDEIQRLIRLFVRAGVDKVRLTGGEPLLRKDLPDLISYISTFPTIQSIGITTNGITLSRHLPTLLNSGLTHINISLDTLHEDKFIQITRRKGFHQVQQSIKNAVASLPPRRVKLNVVVMKGFNDNEILDFCKLTEHSSLDVRFIEWMPFFNNGWNTDRFVSYRDMLSKVQSHFPLERIQDGKNDTTKWHQIPNAKGRIGFITSMSEHFCSSCNRLRITADGRIKVCLFGKTELSLRDVMRYGCNDEELGYVIREAVQKKHFALGGYGNAMGIANANENRPMTLIGG